MNESMRYFEVCSKRVQATIMYLLYDGACVSVGFLRFKLEPRLSRKQVYHELESLQDKGWVESYMKKNTKYYRITEKGQEDFKKNNNEEKKDGSWLGRVGFPL